MSTEAQRIAWHERREAIADRYRAEVIDMMDHVLDEYRLKKIDAKDVLNVVRSLLGTVTP